MLTGTNKKNGSRFEFARSVPPSAITPLSEKGFLRIFAYLAFAPKNKLRVFALSTNPHKLTTKISNIRTTCVSRQQLYHLTIVMNAHFFVSVSYCCHEC